MAYRLIHSNLENNDLKLFESVLHSCYSENEIPLVVSSINKNYFKQAIILFDNAIAVGRIAIYFNPFLSTPEHPTWLLGNYECINSTKAATLLLDEAVQYICEQGGKKIIGPMNGSTWDDHRFSSNGLKKLFFTERICNTYYIEQWRFYGFKILAEYYSGIDTDIIFNRPEVLKRKIELEQIGITFSYIPLHNYNQFLNELYPFITSAFKLNYLYSPISKDDFIGKYKLVEKYINPSYVVLANDNKNEIKGIFFCLPDYLNKENNGLVIKTIARSNEKHLRGLGHVMCEMVYENAHANGIRYLIHAFMHKQGTSVEMSNNYSGKPLKEYFLYEYLISK